MGMTDGQKQLHKLLKEVDDICKRHNITYYAAGGTMIGAVRHRGFLPWDDDADIYMTRDEFNKLVEVTKKEGLPDGRVLGCQELSREYTNVFGRYIDTTTTTIHRAQLVANDEAGEVIDILQLDPVPRDKKVLEKHFELLLIYSDIINENAPYIHRTDVNEEEYFFYMNYMQQYGKTAVLEKIEEQLLCHDEKDCDLYFMRWGGSPIILEKSMFSTVKYVEMEGIFLPIPVNFNEYLVYHYGYEWEQIPPVKHQMVHDTVHCVHHNHNTIKKTYKNVINADRIRKINKKNKESKIFTHRIKHSVADSVVRFRAGKIRQELLVELSDKSDDLKKLYKEHNYEQLNKIFKNYYLWQNHQHFVGRDTYVALYRFQHPILIDLPISIFTTAMKVQMDSGRAGKTLRILEIYEQQKGVLTYELKMIKKAILKMEKAKDHYYLDEFAETITIAEEVLRSFPYNFGMIKLFVRASICYGMITDKVKEVLKRGLEAFPDNGDLLKLQADLLLPNDKDKALKKYLKARRRTSNGIVLLDIDDLLKDHVSGLMVKLSEKYNSGEPEKARSVESSILKIDNSPSTRLDIISVKLKNNPDKETSYRLYKLLHGFKNTANDKKLKSCLQRALYLCGEDSFLNKIHVMIFFNELSIPELDEMIRKADSETRKKYYWELKKYKADLLFENGDVGKAYKDYKNALYNLDKDSPAFKDIKEIIFSDHMHFEKLAQIDPGESEKNLYTKYGTRNNYNRILNQLGATIVYHEDENSEQMPLSTKVTKGSVIKTVKTSDLDLKKAGKIFAGWKAFRALDGKWLISDSDGNCLWENLEGKEPPEGQDFRLLNDKVSIIKRSPGGVIHLYAQWKTRNFTVLYHPGDGEKELNASTTVVFGNRTIIKSIDELNLKKTGYGFNGWKIYRDTDDKWLLKNKAKERKWMKITGNKLPKDYSFVILKDGGSLTKTCSGGTVHLYALWKKLDYTMVLYHADDTKIPLPEKTKVISGKCTKIKTLSELQLKEKTGAFTGWKAYRDIDDKWLLKDTADNPSWMSLNDGKLPFGHSYYLLKDGMVFAKTADASNIHLYAQWKK